MYSRYMLPYTFASKGIWVDTQKAAILPFCMFYDNRIKWTESGSELEVKPSFDPIPVQLVKIIFRTNFFTDSTTYKADNGYDTTAIGLTKSHFFAVWNKLRSGLYSMNVDSLEYPVLRIHGSLVRIRILIRGSIPLTNGSGSGCSSESCYFSQYINIIFQK